jgi:hypothetical protein
VTQPLEKYGGAITRTPEEHILKLFGSMKCNSKQRGHDEPECKSYHELLALCVDRCVGKKLVEVTLNEETTSEASRKPTTVSSCLLLSPTGCFSR